MALLSARNLRTRFATDRGEVGPSTASRFGPGRGRDPGIGRGGCSGKSVTALSVMRLVPEPPGRITAVSLTFDGTEILSLSEAEMREIRGSSMAMIFQDPMRSLNPVLTIGRQLTEVLRRHQKIDGAAARRRAIELLEMVGILMAEKRLAAYPHQFSGGMRQRVMIIALSCGPRLLIADEGVDCLRRHHPGTDRRVGEDAGARARHVGYLDRPRSGRRCRPLRSGERHVRRRRVGRRRSATSSSVRVTATHSASWARRRGSTACRNA